jgi:hypothetical protein
LATINVVIHVSWVMGDITSVKASDSWKSIGEGDMAQKYLSRA